MGTVEFLFDVNMALGNYEGRIPDKARVEFDEKLYERIKQIQKLAEESDIILIRIDNEYPEFLVEEKNSQYEEYDGAIEDMCMEITNKFLWWRGVLGESFASVETEAFDIKNLDECFSILHSKKEELPLLVGHLESEKAKQLLEERLKGT